VVTLKILHIGSKNMALTSPGVEVTITDESQYLPAPTNSVPFVLLATATNKANPNGIGVAQGTTPANAGKLFQVTSQRDLVTLYGSPFFYSTTNGTPIQGYELNEYGLLAAYSALGVTNRVYCLRADIDLASLVGQTGRPSGAPADGSWWLDTTLSTWGIFEFNATTGQFTEKLPIVISDPDLLSGGLPLQTLGSVGDYAVNAIKITGVPSAPTSSQYFYKNSSNTWVGVGTREWYLSVPSLVAVNAPSSLNPGDTLTINIGAGQVTTLTVPSAPNNTVGNLANQINSLGWTNLAASIVNNRLQLFVATEANATGFITTSFNISGSAGLLSSLGMPAGTYYSAHLSIGTSAQQPLWQAGQLTPRPTGSVWIKVGSAGNGLNTVVSEYNATRAIWVPKTVTNSTSDQAVIASLDASGGKSIPAGSVYAQSGYGSQYAPGPVYLWERLATGPTVVTGDNTSPDFTNGVGYTAAIRVSIPGSSSLSSVYTLNVADGSDAVGFATAWAQAAIPYTTCVVTTSGAIQITHTEGGVIYANDIVNGVSNGLFAEAGFIPNDTLSVKYGFSTAESFTVNTTGGSGTDLQLSVAVVYQRYIPTNNVFPNAGTGYVAGDLITVSGSQFGGSSPANDLILRVVSVGGSGEVTAVTFVSGVAAPTYGIALSNWVSFDYVSNEGAPVAAPANNTNWFYSVVDEVDVMVNYNGAWRGYKNQNYDLNGFPSPTGSNATDPNGPIVSASEPTTQSDGTPLVYGDLWISTADLENYPVIYRWQQVNLEDQWILIDNTDQVNPTGVVFADARWAPNGTTNPVDDPVPTIQSLLTSNYLDLDAPRSPLYPTGMLLFNTRRSGYNVKQYKVNYFNGNNFPDQTLPVQKDAWVSASGLQSNGAPFMGRKAQRAMVVQALRAAIDTNLSIRDEDNFFNLMACPNYPELQPNMVALNSDRGETGYILGDTPMRLPEDATAIQAWATNAAGATSTGEDGLVTRNTYLGLFYPSGIAPDLSGNLVAVPASHMMLRTFLRNDTVAYPWLAAAGTRRGIIDNATNIGYLDAATGEFVAIRTRVGIRDVLYTNFINPLVFFTGNGLLNYGNKTSFNSQSALDRTNVARLVAYIRRQLTLAARPFVFEPNDALTRQQIAGVVESLMVDLVAKRGLYDYLVVCDESNNTPARIDRSELWIDVAVEPVKAAEFIYIPVRILNTGELSGA